MRIFIGVSNIRLWLFGTTIEDKSYCHIQNFFKMWRTTILFVFVRKFVLKKLVNKVCLCHILYTRHCCNPTIISNEPRKIANAVPRETKTILRYDGTPTEACCKSIILQLLTFTQPDKFTLLQITCELHIRKKIVWPT